MKNKTLIYVFCIWVYVVAAASAGIEYSAAKNIIWITDYPDYTPCNLTNIAQVDRMNGWNKVAYDPETDTYDIHAHLYVGDDHRRDTYLQIGDAGHPRITLRMHGNIIIYPDMPKFVSDAEYKVFVPDKTTRGVNVLRIGDSENNSITPTIQFASGYGLAMGVGGKRWPYAGELHLYNTLITTASAVTGRVVGVGGWLIMQGRTIRLIDSKVENVVHGIQGVMGGGWDHEIRGMTFENMGVGLLGYWDNRSLKKTLQNCKFINCGIALDRLGSYVALDNCQFRDNGTNWSFSKGVGIKKLFLNDCEVDGEPVSGILP